MENYIIKEVLDFCNNQRECHYVSPGLLKHYALLFVGEGNITYVLDDRKYVLKKNDAVFVRPGTIRERTSDGKPAWWVAFNFEIFDNIDLSLPEYLPGSFSQDIKKLIQLFPYRHILPDNISKQKVTSILNLILLDLVSKHPQSSQNFHVNKILKIVDERLNKKLTLDYISKELKLSKEYISFIFKKETGKTLINYINEQKMLVARELIHESDIPLTKIAKDLAFDNYAYFSRVFKNCFDRTPMEMKRHIHENIKQEDK